MSKKNEIHIHIHQLVGEVKTCPCCKRSTEDFAQKLAETLSHVLESAQLDSLSGQDQGQETK